MKRRRKYGIKKARFVYGDSVIHGGPRPPSATRRMGLMSLCEIFKTKGLCSFHSLLRCRRLDPLLAHGRFELWWVMGCAAQIPHPPSGQSTGGWWLPAEPHPRYCPDWRELSGPRFCPLSRGVKDQSSYLQVGQFWRTIPAPGFPMGLTETWLWLHQSSAPPRSPILHPSLLADVDPKGSCQ